MKLQTNLNINKIIIIKLNIYKFIYLFINLFIYKFIYL